jgi:uncharacterized protein (TIGR03437 family)
LIALAGPTCAADQAAAFFDDSAVREIRLYFDNPNWYNTLFQSHNSDPADPYFPARFQYGSTVIPQIGARFKGNSSFRRNGVKKPFKLDFNRFDGNATFFGLKKLNLHNGDLQPGFLHEKLFLEFAGKYIAAMRTVHVRLFVNDVYYGLYLAVEQPDKTMMQSRFGSDEDGNLWEAGESAAATMAYLGPDPAAYYNRYELKTNESANDYSGLISMLGILNNTPLAELPSKLEPVMDIENFLHGMALNALFTNVESYLGTASEYFLYQRSRDRRFVHIHWDTNETFGSTGDGTPRIANPFTMEPFTIPVNTGGPGGGLPGGGAANAARPLLTRLWAVDAYRRLYLQILARYLREGFDEATFKSRAHAVASLIRADYAADPNKPYTMAQFETALDNQVTANGFTTYGISQFVRERAAYLKPYLAALAQPSDVRLNEIAAVNGGALRDSAGGAGPWLELHNLGPGTVSTAGFYLTDDPANPTKWALPERTLKDGDFLLLWLDGEPGKGPGHANFRASAAGGSLSLYATVSGAPARIDTVTYGPGAAGQSYSRTGLFGSQWNVTSTPTPGAANLITAASAVTPPSAGNQRLLINEFMADNDSAFPDPGQPGTYDDWFEVFNPGPAAVDMSGMYISDNLNNPTKWQVPAGVTIPARGHLVFLADSTLAQGPRHTSWALSADGESISIYEPDGRTLIDSITFGPQRTDVAMGRTTDGASTWSLFAPATPGAANTGALANWILNAAGFQLAPLAPDSIASIFSNGIANSTATAASVPLPASLAGLAVTLTGAGGTVRNAPLYFVSPNQVNVHLPAGTPAGRHRVTIRKQDGATVTGDILVALTAPGLFSANSDGSGAGLIAAIRADAQGNQTSVPVFALDPATGRFASVPIPLGAASDQVHLVLYGTGIRGAALTSVTATVGGVSVPVAYAGAQPEYPGFDQINIGPLPRSLAGRGEVPVRAVVNGIPSNAVTVAIE